MASNRKPKPPEPEPTRRPTTQEDRAAHATALARRDRRPKPVPFKATKVGETLRIEPSLDEALIYQDRFFDALGTRSDAWVELLTKQLANLGEGGDGAAGLAAGVAYLNGIQPECEAEAALAAQMFAAHQIAMMMARRATVLEHMDWIKLASDQMNKASRTYIAGVEALTRLRSGGKQQVEVRYVYVNGPAVFGSVHHGGGGVPKENDRQPYEQLPHAPGAILPEVWSEEQGGQAMSGPGYVGQEAMSPAWRPQPGCAEGARERQLEARDEDPRGGRD